MYIKSVVVVQLPVRVSFLLLPHYYCARVAFYGKYSLRHCSTMNTTYISYQNQHDPIRYYHKYSTDNAVSLLFCNSMGIPLHFVEKYIYVKIPIFKLSFGSQFNWKNTEKISMAPAQG